MAKKNDDLLDAVQDYFFEYLDKGCSLGRKLEIEDRMRAALYDARPEAADGPEKPEPPSVAAPVPQEDSEDGDS